MSFALQAAGPAATSRSPRARPPRSSGFSARWSGLLLLASLVGIASGCRRQEITVYTVPKEKAPPPAAAHAHAHSRPQPMFSWVLPKDWQQTTAGQLSVASFSIKGAGGEEAQVTITPLAKLGGRDVQIVNMWREQLGLDPLSAEEVERQFEAITVAGEAGRLFQIDGTPKDGKSPARILTAVVHRSDASWFYKLAGDATLVEEQKPAFVEFLRTLRIQESSETQTAPETAETADAPPKPNWQAPSHWTEVPAGQMQVAKFTVPGRGSAKAEVSVSRFPNDTGGMLANVNRWRRQLGLAEVKESELAPMVSPLDPKLPDARLVDLSHENRRLLGAVVPREGTYWFYKLMGDAEVVTPERDAFIRFAQSTP